MERINQIKILAAFYGYQIKEHQENIGLLIFIRGGVQVTVYYTTMTVGTALIHPKRGKDQLFRKRVSMEELGRIF